MAKGDKKKKDKKGKEAGPSTQASTEPSTQPMEEDESTASGLPEHLELQRTRVVCGPDMNSHVSVCCRTMAPCMWYPCNACLLCVSALRGPPGSMLDGNGGFLPTCQQPQL